MSSNLKIKKMVLCITSIVSSYLFLELVVSTLYAKEIILPSSDSFWILEAPGRTIQFDPIRGFKLTQSPSRFAQIAFGKLEYMGILRGNAQGFPDRDDFVPKDRNVKKLRIAVFGDSFTAAQYLAKSWPDTVEDRAHQQDISLELLNFSVDGGGLANWWSILKHIVEAENYQLDALLFAVYQGDLRRQFAISETRDSEKYMFARVPSWDPSQWPKTLAQAKPYLRPSRCSYIISQSDFDLALQGQWIPPSSGRSWRPFLAGQSITAVKAIARESRFVFGKLYRFLFPRPPATPETIFVPDQRKMIEQIAQIIQNRHLSVTVVRISSLQELLHKTPIPEDVKFFAAMLNASLMDGAEAFQGLNNRETRSHFLPYDGHWNQRGSDRFSEFILKEISSGRLKRLSTR